MLCFIPPEAGSQKFHRYSQERTMNWLKKKVPKGLIKPFYMKSFYHLSPMVQRQYKKIKLQKTKRTTPPPTTCSCEIVYSLFGTGELDDCFLLLVIGGEDSRCPQEKKHLCGRRSQIHNICQSEVRVRIP